MDSNLLLTAFAVFLVFLNGFFVAAEFAIVKLRMTQAQEMAEEYGLPGRLLASVRQHLDAYLSACQLGITLASLGLGWVGEPAFARLIEPLARLAGIESDEAIHRLAFALAFSLISFLHIVLGELAPKSIAIRKADRVALWTAPALWGFYWLMYPFIWILNGSANLILRLMGYRLDTEDDAAHSAGEIKSLLVASHRHGELDSAEADILSRTLEFSELMVGDLMRPAAEMVMLDLQDTPEENLAITAQHRYSRYPVCDGDRDNIIGLAHVKDLFAALREGRELNDLRSLLREVQMVHRDTPAFDVFELFREGHPHFAIVDDDLGNVIGFVTLDHMLEALVGHIQDEFRRSKDDWLEAKDGSLIGSGTLPLYSLERRLGIDIDVEEVDSVGGLMMWQLGRVPQKGDRVTFPGFSIVVKDMRGPKISRVQVFPDHEPEEE